VNPLGILSSLLRMLETSGWANGDDERQWQLEASHIALRVLHDTLDQLGVDVYLSLGDERVEVAIVLRRPPADERQGRVYDA